MSEASNPQGVGADWCFTSTVYAEHFLKRDTDRMRLMERHPFQLVSALGRFAHCLTDQVLFPDVFGVPADCPWRTVDQRRRHDPEFAAAWDRRARYLRLASGYTLCPRVRSRQVAAEIAHILCKSWAHGHDPSPSGIRVCDIVPTMLMDLRHTLCHWGDAAGIP